MRSAYCFAFISLVLVSGCGGRSQGAISQAPGPSIALAATASSVTRNGASVEIGTTLTGLTGPVTWSLTPAGSGVLTDGSNNLVATFSAAPNAPSDKITITASAGGISQSIQLDLKTSAQPVPYLDLPAVWTRGPLTDTGYRLAGGNPVASAADRSGNLYLAYAAPVSEIKKIGTDGSITTYAHVSKPGSLAFGPDGVLYVVDTIGRNTYAIRRIALDGSTSTLTQTAPFDTAQGTVDGPSGVATAYSLVIAVSPDGVVYATDESRVRKIAPDGSFSTFAGGGCEVLTTVGAGCFTLANAVNGHGAAARFINPIGIVTDAGGNVYVSDYSLIRKITPAGDVSTLVGSIGPSDSLSQDIDGTGNVARFAGNGPLTIDPAGNLYKLSQIGGPLRKITPSGVVSTVATGVSFYAMSPENNIVSLHAGMPGVVVLQSSVALIKVAVD